MEPIITIGICVRNCESSIEQVINDVRSQNFSHTLMEVIFADDGSEDDTLSIITDSIPKMGCHVRVYENSRRGLGSARNMILDKALGKYIVWVDGDMNIPVGFISFLTQFMERNPRIGAAKGRYGLPSKSSLVATLESSRILHDRQDLWGTGGAIFRVKALREVGGFDDRIKGAGEDMDVLIRIQTSGWQVCRTEAVFYERFRTTWKGIWNEYFWWGYGMHYVLEKHKHLIPLYRMTPLVAFLTGLLHSRLVYKSTREILCILLPLHYVLKTTAWLLGFLKAHIQGYGH